MENKVTNYDELISLADNIGEKVPYQLSKEDEDTIAEMMNNVVEDSTTLKEIANLPSNNGVEEHISSEGNREQKVTVNINPVTGEHVVVGPAEEKEDNPFITDTFEDLISQSESNTNVEKIELTDEVIRSGIEEKFGNTLGEVEILQLIPLVHEYHNNKNNEVKDVYNRLPDKIRSELDKQLAELLNSGPINVDQVKRLRKTAALELLNELDGDISYNKIAIDFNDELNKLFTDVNAELNQIYPDSINEKIEKLTKAYDDIKDKEDPEKAQVLLDIKDNLIESYSLTKFKNRLPIKVKKFELEKPNKVYNDFNFKYEKSIYNIHSIALTYPILNRLYGNDYPSEIIVKFIISFCKFCINKKPDNVGDHTFMYYFITNILYLNSISKDSSIEFDRTLIDNIEECLKIIQG